jgi:hypothetical protein
MVSKNNGMETTRLTEGILKRLESRRKLAPLAREIAGALHEYAPMGEMQEMLFATERKDSCVSFKSCTDPGGFQCVADYNCTSLFCCPVTFICSVGHDCSTEHSCGGDHDCVQTFKCTSVDACVGVGSSFNCYIPGKYSCVSGNQHAPRH